MIGVPAFPVREDNDARPSLPDYGRDLQPIFPCVLDAPVWNVERMAPTYSQNLRCIRCLASPVFRRAARAHLALGQVKDAGAVPELSHLEECATTCLLNVVAMGGDGKNVKRFTRGKGRHVSRDYLAR